MTPFQTHLVRQSLATVQVNPTLATEIFFAQLFSRDPNLRSAFPNDLPDQRAMLFAGLKLLAAGPSDNNDYVPAFLERGMAQSENRETDVRYSDLSFALIDMLAVALGDGFTPVVENAWLAAVQSAVAVADPGIGLKAA